MYEVGSYRSESEFQADANRLNKEGWVIHSWRTAIVMAPDMLIDSHPSSPQLRFFVVYAELNPAPKVEGERKPIGLR